MEAYNFGDTFRININDLKSKNDSIVMGHNYRFTVL